MNGKLCVDSTFATTPECSVRPSVIVVTSAATFLAAFDATLLDDDEHLVSLPVVPLPKTVQGRAAHPSSCRAHAERTPVATA
jgi:hypothetical protein